MKKKKLYISRLESNLINNVSIVLMLRICINKS